MRAGLLLAAILCLGAAAAPLRAETETGARLCGAPQTVHGFATCADIARAEQEGEIVVYSPDPEYVTVKLMAAFHDLFPKIRTNYIRLQTGALYTKVLSERQARTAVADLLQLTDMGLVLDFQKRQGWSPYLSPQMEAYKPQYKSQPEGLWTTGGVIMGGIAYNPGVVSAEEAPKSWRDLLDPKWAGSINTKMATSGLQHVVWYELKRLYGAAYWEKFATLEPRGYDSYVQQFDRLVNRQEKIVGMAQYSAYLEYKERGAPIAFSIPPEGMPGGPDPWGIVSDAPHPQAARLFLDWLLSAPGQTVYVDLLFINSVRDDVPAAKGGVRIGDMKLLVPEDWQAFLATKAEFNRDWAKITGVR